MNEATAFHEHKRPQTKDKVVPEAKTARERQNKTVADLLGRFQQLINVAAAAPLDGATKEVAAADALRMEVESAALVRAAEDLLQFTRELKEMWLFGPLRGIGEGEGESKMDEDSQKVGEMIDAVLKNGRETK